MHRSFIDRRRPRPPPHAILVQQGQVAFRVVCHVSVIGGIIGHSGSVISQIRSETGCTVHCEPQVKGSDHRVIIMVGPTSPGRKIRLQSIICDDHEEEEVELVTVAQEAVIRVCERMWEVDNSRNLNEGYCGLLADTSQIGAIIGRGGNNVLRMRRESGAQITVLSAPLCATVDDQLIQITGTTLAVKKALIAVTERLHDCPPYEKHPMLFTRPFERDSHLTSSDPHEKFFPHLSSLLPVYRNSMNSHSLCTDSSESPNQNVEALRHEVSFRLLCSNFAARSIIGKKGTIVRTLQNETGASIVFAAPIVSGQRVVTISALENLESWYSPAQNAVILVFARSIEHDIETGLYSDLIEGATVTARLLVASDAVCCLRGKDSNIDSEMTEVCGVDIRTIEGEQIFDNVSKRDVVIEITGEYKNVQHALFMVTGKLRSNLLPSEVINDDISRIPHKNLVETVSPRWHQSATLCPDSEPESSLARGMNQLGLSTSFEDAASSRPWATPKFGNGHTEAIDNQENKSNTINGDSKLKRSLNFLLPHEVLAAVGARKPGGEVKDIISSGSYSSLSKASDPIQGTYMTQTVGRGLTTSRLGTELESLDCRKRPIVGKTTVELIVDEDIIGFVYGADGSNLGRLRQISGAIVEVQDPSPSNNRRMVVISGTPDQTTAAQSLLQAFILADQ